MEEIEAPMEAVAEEIHHHAHHSNESWISHVALSSALVAVFAAIAALLSNHHANEAMMEQIKASDQWGYFQAKRIKSDLLSTKIEILTAFGKTSAPTDSEKLERYKKEQTEISENAREAEHTSVVHFKHHVVLSRSVTLFQVAIAIAAISVLTKRRRFWIVSLCFATIGLGFLAQGLLPF